MDRPDFMQIEEYFKFRVNYKRMIELTAQIHPIISYELCNGFGAYIRQTKGVSFLNSFEKCQDNIISWEKKYSSLFGEYVLDILNESYEKRDECYREFNEIVPDLIEVYGTMLELYDKYVSEVLLKEE